MVNWMLNMDGKIQLLENLEFQEEVTNLTFYPPMTLICQLIVVEKYRQQHILEEMRSLQYIHYPLECLKEDDCTQDLPIHGTRWKLLKVEYDTDKSHIYEYAPRRVTMQHIDNTRSSIEQSSTFTASRTISETVSYSHTAGVGISVGTEFKAGIPLIGEAKASVQLTADYQFSYGKQRTVERTYSSQYDCVAPPGIYNVIQ